MLARIALRMAAIEAIVGRTLVDDNVLDSDITALEADAQGNLKTDQRKPFVTIYTEKGKSVGNSEPRSLYESGEIELVIESAVAATMVVRNEAGNKETVTGIPATDANLEFHLDMVARQVIDALSDPDSEWADIFRSLCYRIGKIERARTSTAEGTRLAAQQIKLSVVLIDDPLPGEPVDENSSFGRFLAKLEAKQVPNTAYNENDPESPETLPDPVATAKARLMRAQIAGSNKAWETAQRRLGLTRAELLALGLGPIAGDEDRSTPQFEAGEIEVDGIGNTSTVER